MTFKQENLSRIGRKDERVRLTVPNVTYDLSSMDFLGNYGDIMGYANNIGLRIQRIYDAWGAGYLRPSKSDTIPREEPLILNTWQGVCREPLPSGLIQGLQGIVRHNESRSVGVEFDRKYRAKTQKIMEQLQKRIDTLGLTVSIDDSDQDGRTIMNWMKSLGLELEPDPRTRKRKIVTFCTKAKPNSYTYQVLAHDPNSVL